MGERIADPDSTDLERNHIILSQQERRVAEMYFARSMAASDIAESLDIAESTVYTYKTRAAEKIEEQGTALLTMVRNQARIGNRQKLEEVRQEASEYADEYGLDEFSQDEQ